MLQSRPICFQGRPVELNTRARISRVRRGHRSSLLLRELPTLKDATLVELQVLLDPEFPGTFRVSKTFKLSTINVVFRGSAGRVPGGLLPSFSSLDVYIALLNSPET